MSTESRTFAQANLAKIKNHLISLCLTCEVAAAAAGIATTQWASACGFVCIKNCKIIDWSRRKRLIAFYVLSNTSYPSYFFKRMRNKEPEEKKGRKWCASNVFRSLTRPVFTYSGIWCHFTSYPPPLMNEMAERFHIYADHHRWPQRYLFIRYTWLWGNNFAHKREIHRTI